MKRISIKAIVPLVLLLTACGSSTPEEAATASRTPEGTASASGVPAWEEPQHYSYVVRSSCGEQSLIGRFRITVRDGAVTTFEGLDERSKEVERYVQDRPSLQDLLDRAREAERAGADVVNVDLDAETGAPSFIEFDYNTNAIDDESCFKISEVETL